MGDKPEPLQPRTVRPAQSRDSAAIAAIYAHHVRHGTATFDTVPRTEEDVADRIVQADARGWPFLVAEQNGTIVGYAYATPFRDRPAYAVTCEDSIYIASEWTGQGSAGSAACGG